MILSLTMQHTLTCHPGFIPESRATEKGLSLVSWTPQQVRGDTVDGLIQSKIIPV